MLRHQLMVVRRQVASQRQLVARQLSKTGSTC
jgi:hypothetical protein